MPTLHLKRIRLTPNSFKSPSTRTTSTNSNGPSQRGLEWGTYVYQCTAQDWRDRVEILRFIIQRDHDKEENNAWIALYQAAEQGDLLFIQWVVSHYAKRTQDLECVLRVCMNLASRSGYLYVVQWLITYTDALDLSETMFEASKCGRLEIVQWLYENYSSDLSVDLFQERERSSLGDEPTPCTAMDSRKWPLECADVPARRCQCITQVTHRSERQENAPWTAPRSAMHLCGYGSCRS